MNAISKRLLSWLCVVALVLSMAPALNLAGLAVETQAAEEIVYGSANFDGVDAAILEQMNKGNAIDNSDAAFAAHLANNTCPVCGNIDGWEKLSNAKDKDVVSAKYHGKEEHAGLKLHYYYDDAVTKANGNMIGFAEKAKGNTACIWIKSTQSIINNKERVAMVANDNVVNFFGQGTITTLVDEGANNNNMFQISGGVLNLYGGTYIYHHPQNDFRKAAIRVAGAAAVINIFDGATIGPAELDNTKVYQNVQYTGAGTINMFGGIIRNGVSPAWGYAGNVNVANNGIFNMYGGTITGGTFLNADAVTKGVTMNATIGGNVIVGGKNQEAFYNEDGSDNYKIEASGTFNMYGGTISDGKSNNGGNGGGNVYVAVGKAVMNMQGGTISGGYAKAVAGNLQVGSGVANISGTALITGGEAKTNGGNIFVKNPTAVLNISGGKIADGAAPNGGNIYIAASGANTISGGIISGGLATTGNGGNLYVLEPCITITGGTFENGIANNQGGNISTAVDLEIANATIIGGIGRKGGGNINISAQQKTLTLTDCTVANGWVSGAIDAEGNLSKPTGANWGGNVRSWCSNVVIDGGLYYGGKHGVDGKSQSASANVAVLASVDSSSKTNLPGASLTIKGDAVLVGDINVSPATTAIKDEVELTCPGTTLTLEGAPTIINKYTLSDGTEVRGTYGALNLAMNSKGSVKADISGLTTDASIMFTTAGATDGKDAAAANRVVTIAADNAAALFEAGCFTQSNKAWTYALNDANELYVTEIVYEYEEPVRPEAALGGQNMSDEAWEEIVKASKIQYKAKNFELDSEGKAECPACGEVVQWKEATKPDQTDNWTKSRHYYINANTKVTKTYNWLTVNGAKKNEDGTASETTITAENVTVCLMLLNGSTAKEIGGTIGPRNSTKNVTFNIMGEGVITSDGSSTSDAQFGVVVMQGSDNTVNLYGGTFIYTGDGQGRAKDADGKYQPSGAAEAAAITVKGHTNTLNMFNDVTVGPETQDLTKPCYNVRVEMQAASKASTFNMYGGTIRNGVTQYNNTSGNLHLHYNEKYKTTKPTFNMYGGSIVGGNHMESATGSQGGNIYARAGAQLTIAGGTIENGVARDGGNVYIDPSSVSKVAIIGGTIAGGKATRYGGNLNVKATTEISGCALIEGGYAENNGGNIYLTEKKTITQTSGTEVRNGTCNGTGGGNLFVNAGATYNMEGGKIYGGENIATGSNANAGNVLAQGGYSKGVFTDAIFNMSGDAEIYGGIAPNQAGNVRVYIGSVTMTGNAKIYGGDGVKGCDDLWLVDGNLVMKDNATVESEDASDKIALSATVYRRNNTITLKDNATVIGAYNALTVGKNLHADDKVTPLAVTLQIDNGWTGSANVTFTDPYAPASTLKAEDAICGTDVDGVFTKGGTFAGKLYYGSLAYCPITGVEGDMTLAANGVAKADDTGAWFATAAEALAAYQYGVDKYVVLSEDATINGDVVIDLAGQNITLSGKGKVYGLDTANKKFEEFGKLTIAEGAEIEYASHTYHPELNYRFVAVKEGNELSFHYLTISIDTVTLQTEGAGVYYKSKFKCDETLAAVIDGYGMVLSLTDMPVADFMTEDDLNLTTFVEGPLVLDEDGACVATSGAVTGILKADRTAAENQQIAEMKIYSNAYVKVGEEIILFKGGNPYVEFDPEKDVIAYSLKDIMVAIDDSWSKYEDQQATINAFYNTWKDLGLSAWASELENIVAYQPAPAA